MPWTKSEATMAPGVQVLSGRAPRMTPETVTVYRWDCRCGAETTVYLTNPKETPKAFCCGKIHTPEPELLPKPGLLTRLLG
jgi:hypothetical protein